MSSKSLLMKTGYPNRSHGCITLNKEFLTYGVRRRTQTRRYSFCCDLMKQLIIEELFINQVILVEIKYQLCR